MDIKFNFIILLIVISVCSSNAERISEQKCREYGQAVLTKQIVPSPLPGGEPTVVYNSNCQHEETPLIFGGVKAAKHEFPHQAILQCTDLISHKPRWMCGGSLVSTRFVLSAAHCYQVRNCSPVKFVKLGMNKQSDDVHIYDVEELYQHPHYDPIRINNDILLVKLTEEVQINEFVLPICLPTKQYTNAKAIVSGFGRTEHGTSSSDLLKVTVDRFTDAQCIANVIDPSNAKSKLCYGHRTRINNACNGDSGGPLQIYNDANVPCTYIQLGIVSYGPARCGTPRLPGKYTNVFYYLDWIENIVWGNSGNSSSSSSSSED